MEAFAAGANYVGFGTILSTSSKADTEEAKGLSAPAQMCQVATCSIRGTAKTVPYIMQCGARGFAVISVNMYSDRPDGGHSPIDNSD